jgi:hypothetical protein
MWLTGETTNSHKTWASTNWAYSWRVYKIEPTDELPAKLLDRCARPVENPKMVPTEQQIADRNKRILLAVKEEERHLAQCSTPTRKRARKEADEGGREPAPKEAATGTVGPSTINNHNHHYKDCTVNIHHYYGP